MKPAPFDYVRPETQAAAFEHLAAAGGEARPIGGGQSLGPMLNLRLARPGKLVDVSRLGDLRVSRDDARHVEIGAAVTHAEIEDGRSPQPIEGMLRHVAAGIAYRAVRNKGTIGGSLCHADPAADWVSAMTVLDASIVVAGAAGRRRDIAMTEFMVGAYRTALEPGELVRAVRIPKYSGEARWGYYKICRKLGEFADAIGAVVADPARGYCRIVAGSTGAAPLVLDDLAPELARTAAMPAGTRIKDVLGASGIAFDAVKLHQLTVAIQRSIAQALQA
ncbi:MAG: xanthine dehydrogenase family protein subunit M [Parvibaculaceae bacterium]